MTKPEIEIFPEEPKRRRHHRNPLNTVVFPNLAECAAQNGRYYYDADAARVKRRLGGRGPSKNFHWAKVESEGEALFQFMRQQPDLLQAFNVALNKLDRRRPHAVHAGRAPRPIRDRHTIGHRRGFFRDLSQDTLARYLAASPPDPASPFLVQPAKVLTAFKRRCVREFFLMKFGSLDFAKA